MVGVDTLILNLRYFLMAVQSSGAVEGSMAFIVA